MRALLLLALGLFAPSVHAGELLVGNKAADSVWRLALDGGHKLGEFVTGHAPHEIAVSADGARAVVANYGDAQPGHTLTVVDLRGGTEPRVVDLGRHGRPHGVRFLPGSTSEVLVTTEASAALLQVDIERGAVTRVYDIGPGMGHMVAVDADGRTAFVTKIAGGALVRVDLASGEVSEHPAGAGAEGVAVRPGSDEVWVTNREAGTVTVHDPRTLQVRHTLRSEGFPIRVVFTADGRRALVSNAKAATLAVFDARRRVLEGVVALARDDVDYKPTLLGQAALPIGVAVDPERPRAYVAIAGGDEVAVVDLDKRLVLDRWPTGREPDALGVAP